MDFPKHPAHFPKTVADLFQLNTSRVIALLKEYGIAEVTEIAAASPLSPGGAAREEYLNLFMSFIGVRLSLTSPWQARLHTTTQVGLFIPPLSATTANSPSGLMSPVITRRHAWPGL